MSKNRWKKRQKEYYLREQMKAIQKELGDAEGRAGEVEEAREQLEKSDVPEHVRKKIEKELERYEKMPPTSAESSVIRTYIDWLLSLPWTKKTEDRIEIDQAEKILDEDHYGLDKPEGTCSGILIQYKNWLIKLKVISSVLVGPPWSWKNFLSSFHC